jgi:hypothetical protein
MASLQARHTRKCALYLWTPFAETATHTREEGDGTTTTVRCTCVPLYHVAAYVDGKRQTLEQVGHNRKDAERALDTGQGRHRPPEVPRPRRHPVRKSAPHAFHSPACARENVTLLRPRRRGVLSPDVDEYDAGGGVALSPLDLAAVVVARL